MKKFLLFYPCNAQPFRFPTFHDQGQIDLMSF